MVSKDACWWCCLNSFLKLYQDNWFELCLSDILESKHHVSTKCVAIDFSGGIEIYDAIANQLTGLEIGVLGEFHLLWPLLWLNYVCRVTDRD